MNPLSYIFGIITAVITLFVVIELLRRRRLRERHAIYWLVAGTASLIFGIFPNLLVVAAGLVGIAVPTNLVFFVSIFILFFVCIQHATELTALETQTRVLAEEIALQDLRIRALESAAPTSTGTVAPSANRDPLGERS